MLNLLKKILFLGAKVEEIWQVDSDKHVVFVDLLKMRYHFEATCMC